LRAPRQGDGALGAGAMRVARQRRHTGTQAQTTAATSKGGRGLECRAASPGSAYDIRENPRTGLGAGGASANSFTGVMSTLT
jgi:hypothetical protein